MITRLLDQERWPISLSTRICAGFLVVLLLHLVVAVTGHLGLDRAKVDLHRFDVGRRLSVQMVEIDRLVGEMQRSVQAFTHSGHDGYRERGAATAMDLARRIRAARAVAGPAATEDLDRMEESLSKYRATFALVVDGRKQRVELVEGQLARLTKATLDLLEFAQRRCDDVAGPVDVLHRVEVLLLQAVNLTNEYLTRLEPAAIREAKDLVLAAGELVRSTSWPERVRRDVEDVVDVVSPLHGVLVQILQSTHSYLHLINVVLPGEAAAFLRGSSELRQKHLADLDALQKRLVADQDHFQWVSAVISIVTIVLGILAGSMIGRSIVRPVREITTTLARLADGHDEATIPGRNRLDEIGEMAKAAQVFRERNEETSELLDETRRLSRQREQVIADLERSNRDLDSFAYIASHDLRAPLRAMNAAIGWLDDDCGERLSPAGRESLELLRGRVQRMKVLIEDLLDYSCTTRARFDAERTELQPFARGVVAACAIRDGIRIHVDVEPVVVEVCRRPLERVLASLVDNAVKHHDAEVGNVEVRATLTSSSAGVSSVEFEVRDDGPGIPVEYREQVFEPFQLLRPRDQVEGSGVGLALVAALVNKYEGTVGIESCREGRGVVFRVTWPARALESAVVEPPTMEVSR